jgi:uncharacterized membrane protein YeaQ/YmgE (transglycosylase-associated protein family)
MKKALVDMFGSKKALAAMAGTVASALVLLAGKQGYALDAAAAQSLVQVILGLVGAYVLGQGVADLGKEKAKLAQAVSDVVSTTEKLPEASEPTVLTEEA